MPLSSARFDRGRHAEIVMPDCCNGGVVFRSLLGVNTVVLAVGVLRASQWALGLRQFVETSIVVQLSCLWSLLALCILRRVLQRVAPHGPHPLWAQRAACAAVPAAVTGIVVYSFSSVDWVMTAFVHMTVVKGMFVAALFGAALQHYFELRARAFSPALVEARLQALQARIRPHFLFNSLNAVLSLIRDEPQRAESALEDLSDLFRVLMSDPGSMTSLKNELRLCEQYLSIERIRLGERLQVEWHPSHIAEDILRKAQIPVLLLQPLLENAVRHGVEPSPGPSPVQIHVGRTLDRIEIRIVNSYHGQVPLSGNHIALANIRERLALLYDVEAQLTTTIANGLFEVKLRFPYVKGCA